MEVLEKLEQRIPELLAEVDRLKAENARTRSEAEATAARITELKEENRRLRASLAQEESTRAEALKRLDVLLRKIEEHENIE
ncbi:MAG: cell division protein ZapB [Desulfovibrio sp.]|jgi:cell division protein ZapB|nr:cell division protein ZapB [Desulfovibrio sp.]